MRPNAATIFSLAFLATRGHAHPLGNFTVNHLLRLAPSDRGIHLLLYRDLAEIPTFQELSFLGPDGSEGISGREREAYGRRWLKEVPGHLVVEVDDGPVDLEAHLVEVDLREGQAGLPTLRITASLDLRPTGRAALASGE